MRAEEFIQFLASEKHYSHHTLIAYRNDLSQFFSFTESQFGLNEVSLSDHQIIRSWLAHLVQSGTNPRNVNRKLSTLKSYFRFLIKRGVIAENPMQRVVAPKVAKKLPAFVSQAKMDELFNSIGFEPGFHGMRSRMVMEMLYATGMRVSELTALKHNDIDTSSQALRVIGKRNKQRIIPFTSHLQQVIKAYIEVKESHLGPVNPDDYFISSIKGKKAYPKLIYNIVTQSLALVTTQTRKSPHIIRHTFATGMLNNGADLNAIKELLGHASLAATQVYTHNTIERIKRIYQQAHPKA